MNPSPQLAVTIEAARGMLRKDIFFREENGHVLFPVEGSPGKFLCCFVHWRFEGDKKPFMQTMEVSNDMTPADVFLVLESSHWQFCENIEKYRDHPELIPQPN